MSKYILIPGVITLIGFFLVLVGSILTGNAPSIKELVLIFMGCLAYLGCIVGLPLAYIYEGD